MMAVTTGPLAASRPGRLTLERGLEVCRLGTAEGSAAAGRGRAIGMALRATRAALSLVLVLAALAYLRGLAAGVPFVLGAEARLALLAVVAARLVLLAAPWWLESHPSGPAGRAPAGTSA
jgi:hypothetical protein